MFGTECQFRNKLMVFYLTLGLESAAVNVINTFYFYQIPDYEAVPRKQYVIPTLDFSNNTEAEPVKVLSIFLFL